MIDDVDDRPGCGLLPTHDGPRVFHALGEWRIAGVDRLQMFEDPQGRPRVPELEERDSEEVEQVGVAGVVGEDLRQ